MYCVFASFSRKGVILSDDLESWHMNIKAEIDAKVDDRPVLVFFETLEILEQFQKSNQCKSLSPVLLDQRVPQADRDRTISIAMQGAGVVTLCTRDFGRGTDFMCHDQDVIDNGGVHVIQTFVSRQKTEEIQIKGRTARQDNPGSFAMVLLSPALEKFGITMEDVKDMASGAKKLYSYIDFKRLEYFEKTYPESVKGVEISKIEHEASVEYLENLLHCKRAGAADAIHQFILERNRCFVDDSSPDGRRALVLFDATGSMYQALELVKSYLAVVFTRCFEIIEKNLGKGAGFEMQLGVYRNYNCSTEKALFSATDFSSTAAPILKFLSNVHVDGGWGREAIEIGFAHALNMHHHDPVSQIIVVGDAPPNNRADTKHKRARGRCPLSKWKEPVFFDDLHQRVVNEGIVVNSVYVPTQASAEWRRGFMAMTANGGFSEDIVLSNKKAGEQLCAAISKCILKQMSKEKGSAMVSEYDKIYGKGYK